MALENKSLKLAQFSFYFCLFFNEVSNFQPLTHNCFLFIQDENSYVVPDYCGKLQLNVEEAVLFLAISYKGDPNESYVCLLADKSALYHEGWWFYVHSQELLNYLIALKMEMYELVFKSFYHHHLYFLENFSIFI